VNPLRAAAVQFNHQPSNKSANLTAMRGFVDVAARADVDLLAFPEMCITGYWHVRDLDRNDIDDLAERVPDGRSTRNLLEWSAETGMTIGAGLVERSSTGELFNSYVIAMSDGRHAVHRKLHCFISPHMASGDDYTVFMTPDGTSVGVLTCWDNNLVENVRITALAGAEVLMAPHQTGGCDSRSPDAMGLIDPQLWHDRTRDPEALAAEFAGPKGREWLMRWLPSRAHDNGMFILFANGVGLDDDEVRTGNAMILDPYGKILEESRSIDDDIVIADLDPDRLTMCTGQRWLRGRRPELYEPLTQPAKTVDARTARFSTTTPSPRAPQSAEQTTRPAEPS
jgi:predicted amidohydrolase